MKKMYLERAEVEVKIEDHHHQIHLILLHPDHPLQTVHLARQDHLHLHHLRHLLHPKINKKF
jgi:hypothetical protein